MDSQIYGKSAYFAPILLFSTQQAHLSLQEMKYVRFYNLRAFSSWAPLLSASHADIRKATVRNLKITQESVLDEQSD